MTRLDLRAEARAHELELGALPPIDPRAARLVESTWRGRMVNEHASARVFAQLLGPAMAAGLSAARQAELLDFAREELTHARMCAGVLASLGHEAVGELPPLPEVPLHADAEPLEAFLRNIISVCCLSETCASALIARERIELGDSPLAEVLGRILADEVGHARFGWKLLEDTERSAALNARLEAYLPVALAHLEEHELAHLAEAPAPPAAVARGACDGASARDVFYDTVEQVILPRLEQHGLRAERAWARRGAASRLRVPPEARPA